MQKYLKNKFKKYYFCIWEKKANLARQEKYIKKDVQKLRK